jgi:hypothetical protein
VDDKEFSLQGCKYLYLKVINYTLELGAHPCYSNGRDGLFHFVTITPHMPAELVPLSFYVLNVKLQTNKANADRDQVYSSLFKMLEERRIHERVAKDKHMMILSSIEGSTMRGIKFIHGTIGKGILFDRPGTRIHIPTNTTQSGFKDDENIFQWKATHYVFIPEAHRFCLFRGGGISINEARSFLFQAIPKVIDRDDKIVVEIENDESPINEIFSAERVRRLTYKVTYTNEDFLKSMGEELDETLKNAGIGEITVDAKADHQGNLKIKDEKLLQGGIELAKENGTVSAVITTNGKSKYVTTEKTPLLVEYKTQADSVYASIVNYIKQKFRPTDDQATV